MTGPPPAALLRRWAREQARLKGGVVAEDTEEWQKEPSFAGLERVGGVDLSYVKGDDSRACASLVVLSYPGLEVLYEDCQMVAVSAPYVAGFLAFREVPFLVEAVQRLQQEEPRLKPQVLLVDGNGLLHHRGFGVACHLGVLTDLPCIGVAKNLLQVDGLARDELHREQIRSLQRGGDTFPLTGTSGNVLGMGVPGDSCASSPVLLQVPDPGAHPPGNFCDADVNTEELETQLSWCFEPSTDCSAAPLGFSSLLHSTRNCGLWDSRQPADIRSREYIRKQMCSPVKVPSSGPERKEKAELDD
ncbi:endonuclease V isoform X2 [Cygnus olor]|uniref:endonuclease V isoform X2 n=1 Tax=Cygnus olor TaxID=8869 RepID=UPI001ADE98AF|nr:endonuclease V isoform X2 [Cygnus olor]